MNASRISIENVRPQIDCGRYPSKRVIGDTFTVEADIFTHGSERIRADLRYRKIGNIKWKASPMTPGYNDRWTGSFTVEDEGLYEYTIGAWIDTYATVLGNIESWYRGGESISSDLAVVSTLLSSITERTKARERSFIIEKISAIKTASPPEVIEILKGTELGSLVQRYQKKLYPETYGLKLRLVVERKRAGFASWYELFPRSQGVKPGTSGTFLDCVRRLPDIAAMGFDVLYLTPIHPIGITQRRGKNGSRVAKASDPGSPWAIGNADGGHDSINPELGTMEEFIGLIREAAEYGIEIALDLAFQCSPDHPYVTQHPDWFFKRPDGTIRYAENPPKKYYDIFPLNFDSEDWENLWLELRRVVIFWVEKGIKIFRVDNPHTKPFEFWEWLIREVRTEYPDVIFLAEAFTRPAVMYELSKLGFSMSYTYFTWRNYDFEIRDYFTELSSPPVSDHFRPMLFTNTPDILPAILQAGGRAAFKIRAVLAATLSPLWGIYSGFELCENEALENSEEYLNSEKYEIKIRNWNSEGNITQLIASLNSIRRENISMQEFGNLRFHQSDNPNIIFYSRVSADRKNAILVAVNLNPRELHSANLKVPLDLLGVSGDTPYKIMDLLTGELYVWQGMYGYVRLTPDQRMAHVFRVER
ncbi:MAG: alpha-1,4-glucan--maltose-1-phosphate maltosyltransferase [Candidatus Thermoplasmatota archaeon]|nr:alpha-1,4-glucan--maltose-1-phosphate maltosyltransferase [Candidatus Thermoplasmatota archaeon]